MSDVKWSDLFPRTTGGKGGTFKSVVVKDATAPYQVKPFDRLIIDATEKAFTIDPSLLKEDDDAFEIVDAARAFSKNPVTIKGDKVTIQMAGAGNDLILDMIGAGNTWGFVFADTDLFVAYSPENTNGGTGNGGNTPAPAMTVDDKLDINSTNPIQNKPVAAAVVQIDNMINGIQNEIAQLKPNPNPNPGTAPAKFTPITISREGIKKSDPGATEPSEQDIRNAGVAPDNVDYGTFNLIITPPTARNWGMAGHLVLNLPDPRGPGELPIRILRDAGSAFVRDANEDYEVRIVAPDNGLIYGTWGDFQGSMKSISLDAPWEYVELSPMTWPENTTGWVITGTSYNDEDLEAVQAANDITAEMGSHVQVEVQNATITIPSLRGDQPPEKIIVDYRGYYDAGNNRTVNTGNISIKLSDPIFGVFRNKAYPNVTPNDLALLNAGEWIEFEPLVSFSSGGDRRYWLIRGAAVNP